MEQRIQLGDRVRDRVSGFTGVVTARIETLFDTPDCRVEHAKGKAELPVSAWFSEARLSTIGDTEPGGLEEIELGAVARETVPA